MVVRNSVLIILLTLCGLLQADDSRTWREVLDQADSLSNEGQQDTAIVIGTLALLKAEAEFGPEDTAVARALGKLASYHFFKQDYQGAIPYYQRAQRVLENSLGADHPAVGHKLTNLAVVYRRLGRYAEAEPLYERAMAIWEGFYGPDHESVGFVLNNLCALYEVQGRFAEAEVLLQRALAIWKATYGLEHQYVTLCLSSLAFIRQESGRYAEAESLFTQVLAIRERLQGLETSWVAGSLYDLAKLYRLQGRTEEGVAFGKRSLAVAEKNQGPDHPAVAMHLHNLADLYCDQGKYTEAEPLLERALSLKVSALGYDNYDVASIEESYSRLFRLLGDTAKAIDMAARACKTMHKSFVDNAMVLSEKDALNFSRLLHKSVDNFISCYYELGSGEPSAVNAAANLILATKGHVSDGLFDRQRTVVQETDSVTLAVAEALRVAKLRLSRRYIEGPGEDADRFRIKLDSLSTLVNKLETNLSRQSASFRKEQKIKVFDVDSVRTSLPENSCLIGYLKFDYLKLQPDRTMPHYLAIVVTKDTEPVILNLGPTAPIDSLIDLYRQHMLRAPLAGLPSEVDGQEYSFLATALYRKLWKPVQEYISEARLVLIAPDGGLNLVSFAGLLDDDGSYLIESRSIHYLSAGRDLARLKNVVKPAVGLLALGDPDYDASVSDRLSTAASHKDTVANPESSEPGSTRMGRGEFRGMKVNPLPWTRREVNRVAKAWAATCDETVELLCGSEASEDRLKAAAPGKRVIHLATHGYFLQDSASSGNASEGTRRNFGPTVRNPLLESGLFFAGANQRGQGSDGAEVDDGILTAFEVSAMNLQGAQWVVLSACESGLGEVKAGEGVWGLRRAFQMAGARAVISALWSIPDKQTVSVMEQLYSSDDRDLARIMRRMAINEIEKMRKRGLPDHPYAWAAFVAVGDWRIQK